MAKKITKLGGSGGQATRGIIYRSITFGPKRPALRDALPRMEKQLKLSIASDHVVISTRHSSSITMTYVETAELLAILNREFILDALGAIHDDPAPS